MGGVGCQIQRALKPHYRRYSHRRSSVESWREGKKKGRGKREALRKGLRINQRTVVCRGKGLACRSKGLGAVYRGLSEGRRDWFTSYNSSEGHFKHAREEDH